METKLFVLHLLAVCTLLGVGDGYLGLSTVADNVSDLVVTVTADMPLVKTVPLTTLGDEAAMASILPTLETNIPGYDVDEYNYLLKCYYWFLRFATPLSYGCNLLAFITFVGMSKRQNIALVLMCLAISDSISMIIYIETLMWVHSGYSVHLKTLLGCKLIPILYLGARSTSNWLCFLVAFERFLAVRFPLKVSLWCTRRRIVVAICCCVIFGVGTESWRPTTLEFIRGTCVTPARNIALVGYLGFALSKVFSFIVPWSLIALFNTQLIVALRKWTQKMQVTLGATGRGTGPKGGVDRSLTVMFLGMSAFSLICVMPSVYVDAKYFSHTNQGGDPFEYISLFGSYHIIMIAECFLLSNYSFNFFIYCLTGSSFRSQLIEVLRNAVACVTRQKYGACECNFD